MLDDRRALTTEDVDPEIGKGSEFTYENGAAVAEVHQLKCQNGNSNSWTIRALGELGIFDAAVAQGTEPGDVHKGLVDSRVATLLRSIVSARNSGERSICVVDAARHVVLCTR